MSARQHQRFSPVQIIQTVTPRGDWTPEQAIGLLEQGYPLDQVITRTGYVGDDPTVPSPLSGDPGNVDGVAVCWDGRHQLEWVDPADLVPAAAVVAVA